MLFITSPDFFKPPTSPNLPKRGSKIGQWRLLFNFLISASRSLKEI
jgi:hypothetical protein